MSAGCWPLSMHRVCCAQRAERLPTLQATGLRTPPSLRPCLPNSPSIPGRLALHLQIIHLQPKKKEALAWLDGTGPMPARFAKVIVIRGASQPRDVMEYQVGAGRMEDIC